MLDLTIVISSFIGTLLAGITLLIPIIFIVRKTLRNFNPMASIIGDQQ